MEKYKKLGRNFIIVTIGSFASRTLSFFLVPLYTSILTTMEYGVIDLVTTTLNLALPFISLSLYEAVTRFALEDKTEENLKQLFSISLYCGIVGLAIFSVFSFLCLRTTYFGDSIELLVLLAFAMLVNQIVIQLARGKERMVDYAVAGILQTVAFITSNILFLVVLKIGIRGYLWAYFMGNIASATYLCIRCRVYCYLAKPKQISRNIFKKMLLFSVPLIPNTVSWWISSSSDKYILTAFRGVSENGIYSAAYKIPTILTVFASLFFSAWQISAVDGFGTEETRLFYEDIRNKYSKLLVLGATALIAFIKPVSKLMLQKDFVRAWVFTPVLILASACGALANFYGSVFSTANKTKTLFTSTLLAALVNIVLNFLLIPFFGGMGAAIATFVSYAVILLVRYCLSRRFLLIHIDWPTTVLSYIIVVAESVLVITDNNWYFIPGLIAVLLLLFINRTSFLFFLRYLKNRYLKVKGR